MAFNATIQALESITDFSNFERLCCDLLSCFKYEGIVPRGVGKIDGGIDAALVERSRDTVTSVIKKTVFHFSTRKDYETKIYEDLKKTRKHQPSNVVFVTNRHIEPLHQDKIIKKVKKIYGWDLIIYDQEWLRIPLDTSYQNIRRIYLGIDYELTIFENLDCLLENKNRNPNREDFEKNLYYWNHSTHNNIHALLKEKRKCLIKGKPGSGKSALARGIGYKLIKENPKNIVLYLTAGTESSCHQWLSQIQRYDYFYVLYIIDDCHNAIDAVNELMDRWYGVKNAKVLLISRSINPDLAGPSEVNYLRILEDDKCLINREITVETIWKIVKLYVPDSEEKGRKIGDTEKILEKCQGDLYLLNYYIKAWIEKNNSKALSEIEEDEILDDVYRRYLKDGSNPEYVHKICALWRFEIPIQFNWICNQQEINSIQEDAFIESFVNQDYDHPWLFFRYFHSTPANYLLKAVYKKGELGKSIDEYTKEQIKDYLSCKPLNFFDVFSQLYKNGGEVFQYQLFSGKEVFRIYKEIITDTEISMLMNRLHTICAFLTAVWQWEGKKDKGVAYNLFQLLGQKTSYERWRSQVENLSYHHIVAVRLIGRIDKEFCNKVILSLDFKKLTKSEDIGLATVMNFLQVTKQAGVGRDKLNAFCEGLDFRALGERSKDSGLGTIRTFLELTKQAGVDRDKLNALCEGLDFRALGERSKDTGLATLMTFLKVTKQAGVDRDRLNAFCEKLDFRALGERSKDSGLGTIRTFLELTKQAGVDRDRLNAFCEELDFRTLGKRSKDIGLATVMRFLQLTKQAGVSKTILKSFCESLDWKILGESAGKKMKKMRNPFFELHSLRVYPFISKEMAMLFMEGIGWTTLNKAINERFGPDILAVALKLLKEKCNLTRDELVEKGLDLSPHKIWLNSFVNNPRPKVGAGQQLIQQSYLSYAGACFVKFAEKEFSHNSLLMSLKSWNIFIHNISASCPKYLEEKIIPQLKGFSVNRLEKLFCESDLSNISRFLKWFNPEGGIFRWSISDEVNFKRVNFLEKIEDSTLEAISHFLFNFYFISRGECSNFFAEQLDNDYSQIIPKIKNAGIAELDFFFWNFWMAMPKSKKPRMFNDKRIRGIILDKATKETKDKECLLGLIGSLKLSMSAIPEGLIELITAENAKSICKKTIKEGSIKFIRLFGGCLLLLPKDDLKETYNDIQKTSFQFNICVPNQIDAVSFINSEIKR